MNENFINFHVLISHSPSCLNRDDMNMQKSAIFGGKRRVRVSSQSLKRAMRKSDYYQEHLGVPSLRTRQLGQYQDFIVGQLKDRFDTELVKKAVEWLSGKSGIDTDTKGDAVAPWAVEEVAYVCEQITLPENQELDEKKLQKLIEKENLGLRQALAHTIDIALSGRMATSGLMSAVGKVDGALAVAQSITTHAVDADIDWFTAVDDLKELGSGHLDTQEFSSGVFYRYASLNLQQLQKNLGDASREQVLDVAAHVLHMLATEVPSAKQQSFAAHNFADLAMVSFSHQPLSLANAFESPIKEQGEGFCLPSIQKLNEYWQTLTTGYALNDRCAEFVLKNIEAPQGMAVKQSLPALEQWLRNNGEG